MSDDAESSSASLPFHKWCRTRIMEWVKFEVWPKSDEMGEGEKEDRTKSVNLLDNALSVLKWTGANFRKDQWDYTEMLAELETADLPKFDAKAFLDAVASKSRYDKGTKRRGNPEAKGNGGGNGREDKTAKQTNLLPKVSISASATMNKDQKVLDGYSLPLSHSVFMPNQRLRQLQVNVAAECAQLVSQPTEERATELSKTEEGAERLRRIHQLKSDALKLANSLPTGPRVYRSIDGGNETKIVDHWLSVVMQRLRALCKSDNIGVHKGNMYPAIHSNFVLCKRTSLPEPCILFQSADRPAILVGSEAKGTEASELKCSAQGLILLGDASLQLRTRFGIEVKECATPGILAYGTHIRFIGVYLLSEGYPCPVFLSRGLDLTVLEDIKEIYVWLKHVARFALASQSLIRKAQPPEKNFVHGFTGNGYFIKPVRIFREPRDALRPWSRHLFVVNRVMMIFKLLFDACDKDASEDELFNFPVGIFQVPSAHDKFFRHVRKKVLDRHHKFFQPTRPCLVFPELAGWNVHKPSAGFRVKYLQKLKMATRVMKRAGVVHLDLRPANVMWKCEGEEIQVKVIDFEHAYLANEDVDLAPYSEDSRYACLFSEEKQEIDETTPALCSMDDWFVKKIELYLKSSAKSFTQFCDAQASPKEKV